MKSKWVELITLNSKPEMNHSSIFHNISAYQAELVESAKNSGTQNIPIQEINNLTHKHSNAMSSIFKIWNPKKPFFFQSFYVLMIIKMKLMAKIH